MLSGKRGISFLDYACKTKPKEIILNSEEQEFIWIDPKEALNLPVETYTKKAIEKFIKKFPNGF
ncbi:MAG: hypothetical protein J7J92_03590 [Candidatus Aenigmarchaeota archaeon]|nr:hypothetical protein [Candidatus Aenigmarchaeota archaeon]